MENTYSSSGAYDQEYVKGTELFVSIDRSSDSTLSGTIKGVKRDTQMVTIVGLFILILLAIGKKQGFYSIISLFINIILLIGALNIYVLYNHVSLLAISSIAVVIFTIVSLLLVSGKQEKTYVSIISTLLGTFLSLLIAFVVIHLTDANGLRYEGMEFLNYTASKNIYEPNINRVLRSCYGYSYYHHFCFI
ncbi:YibE/F family protein [Priestia megaterium]|nr:YibE/F family protein [Priestia megaterium]MED4202040.1 YibE/F family protein [Priestia megaterium]